MKRIDRPASPLDPHFLSKFDPDQPRDADGRWSETGAASAQDERADVEHYAREAGAATALNGNLREGKALSPGQERMRRALEASITRAGVADKPFTVYRGAAIPFEKLGPALAAVEAGKPVELTLTGFQSTSLDYRVAASSGVAQPGKSQVVFEIETRRGAPLHEVSPHKSEREVLLGHGWTYQVTGHGRDSVGRTILRLRETGSVRKGGGMRPGGGSEGASRFFQPESGIVFHM